VDKLVSATVWLVDLNMLRADMEICCEICRVR